MAMDENQRSFKRRIAHLQVELISKDGHIALSESNDISEGGMLLTIPEDAISRLEASGMIIGEGEELRVSVSNPKKTIEFVILCSIAHLSVNAQGQYLVGVAFEDKRDSLNTFIQYLLKTING